jgi:hypothetical protein
MKRRLIASIACLLFAQPAVAEQWVHVADSLNGEKSLYLDFDSVKGTGNTRTFWQHTINSDGSQVKAKAEVNCSNDHIGIYRYIEYDRHGNIVENIEGYYNTEIIPNTIGRSVRDYICDRITHQPPAPTYVPAYTPTPTYTENKAHCGDYLTAAPGEVRELWPVYVDYSPELLSYIKNSMCRDAFVKTVEGGYKVIQVSSHTSYDSAERMANKMYSRVGSGFVGISVVREF